MWGIVCLATPCGSRLPSDFEVTRIGAIGKVAFQRSLQIGRYRSGIRGISIQDYKIDVVQPNGCQGTLRSSCGIFVEIKENTCWVTKTREKIHLRGIGFGHDVFAASMLADKTVQFLIFARRYRGDKQTTAARKRKSDRLDVRRVLKTQPSAGEWPPCAELSPLERSLAAWFFTPTPNSRKWARGRDAFDRTTRSDGPSRVGLQPVGALLVRAKGRCSSLKKRRCAGAGRLLGEGANGGLSGHARTAATGGSDRDFHRRRSGRPHHEPQGWRWVVRQWLGQSDVGLGNGRMEHYELWLFP